MDQQRPIYTQRVTKKHGRCRRLGLNMDQQHPIYHWMVKRRADLAHGLACFGLPCTPSWQWIGVGLGLDWDWNGLELGSGLDWVFIVIGVGLSERNITTLLGWWAGELPPFIGIGLAAKGEVNSSLG